MANPANNCVYLIRNNVNGKVYVGKTGQLLSGRWNEQRENLSRAQSGKRNGFYGKRHSKESRLKISEARRRALA